jgi:hypothetical protein
MSVARGTIRYGVGSKNNPGDPFGRSSLTIELDGKARLQQDTRGGLFTFTGTVIPSALEQFWSGLDRSSFPVVEPQRMPAGSATRALRIGDVGTTFPIPYHAAGGMPGFNLAFSVLDQVIRQISLDMVKEGVPGAPIVEGAARVTVPRGRISYVAGNKENPSDPWGRSSLTIELDGTARLEQDTLGGLFVFTGQVLPSALEQFWSALDLSGFPEVPEHFTPAGSTSRHLTIGESLTPRLPVDSHAVMKMPGYAPAFSVIDAIIRQLSLEMVKEGPTVAPVVEGAQRMGG